MAFVIYLIRCEENGKLYVGQTSRSIDLRFKEHLNHAINGKITCRKLYSAIRKYGTQSFSIEKLVSAETQQEANRFESLYIKEYDTIKNGYNLQQGGYNGSPSEETRKLMSEKHSGENNSMFGKHHSNESKNQISKTRQKLFAEGLITATWEGKSIPQETRNKISVSRKGLTVGENNPGAKLTLDQVNEIKILLKQSNMTMKQIASMFNISLSAIKRIKAGTNWK